MTERRDTKESPYKNLSCLINQATQILVVRPFRVAPFCYSESRRSRDEESGPFWEDTSGARLKPRTRRIATVSPDAIGTRQPREPGGKTRPRPSGGYKTLSYGRLSLCVLSFNNEIALEAGNRDWESAEWDGPPYERPVLSHKFGVTVQGSGAGTWNLRNGFEPRLAYAGEARNRIATAGGHTGSHEPGPVQGRKTISRPQGALLAGSLSFYVPGYDA